MADDGLTTADPPIDSQVTITREALLDGSLRRMIEASGYAPNLWTDAQRDASLRETLDARPTTHGDDVWVFGYGSLIWNPAFHFVERRVGTVTGLHRQFCLSTPLGRGSPDRPGLVLGLDQGGACQGMAFRIAPDAVETELDVVWRREMLGGAYIPTWVEVATTAGPVTAVTFSINHAHERYAGDLSEDEVVETIATACGQLGSCAEYLINTVEHLDELGLDDPHLARLRDRVRRRMDAERERER